MPGEKARQLIRRKQEVDGGNDKQDDAEQGQYQLHGLILLKMDVVGREIAAIVYRQQAWCSKGAERQAVIASETAVPKTHRPFAEPAGLISICLPAVLEQVLIAQFPVLPQL
jgi:hypothetical protein